MAKKDYSNWSKQELIRELKKIDKIKKYGIVWEDKPERLAEMCKKKLPVLEEDTKKEILTDKEKPVNILIEGDNYHALSVLNYTHKGKIDAIYIDPPYNTANDGGFLYNDKIIDKNDSYRHSKWISFMSKRLNLSKNLLKNNGVIFISIDENEFAQLKLLCDEIFGERNLIVMHVWRKTVGGKSQGKISTQHEYILTYAKNEPDLKIANLPISEDLLKKYKYQDKRGRYMLRELGQGKGLSYSSGLYYEIKTPDGSVLPKPPEGKGYRWTQKKWEWGLKINPQYSVLKKVKGRWVPFAKQYLNYDNEGNRIERGIWPHSWLEDKGHTRTGTKDLDDVLGTHRFKHPKPVKLIKYLISLIRRKDAIILDFFVGSGTTAQAVIELNNEEKTNRKFVICTNNENNICAEVCYPRIKKVIENLEKKSKGKLVSNRPGGLKYFKTDFVDAEPTDTNKHKMVDKSTEMLCLKEDCFDEVLKGKRFRIFKNGQNKHLGVIYDDNGIRPFKKEVKKLKKNFIVYVFSLDESAREDEFQDVAGFVDLKPIPAVILNVYRRIFK